MLIRRTEFLNGDSAGIFGHVFPKNKDKSGNPAIQITSRSPYIFNLLKKEIVFWILVDNLFGG